MSLDPYKNRTLVDVVTLVLVTGITVAVVLELRPTRLGFFCDDQSIRYPFNGETINTTQLVLLVCIVPFILIVGTEFGNRKSSGTKCQLSGFYVSQWISVAYKIFIDYFIAATFMGLFIELIKCLVGSLRPSFIYECQPNINMSNCAAYGNKYITDYECINGDHKFFRTSFPSGHAAVSGLITWFCVTYIQIKWITTENSPLRLIKHIFMGCIIFAFACVTLSRYTDHVHYPIDLIIGYAIGTGLGFYTVFETLGHEEVKGETIPLITPSTSRDLQTRVKTIGTYRTTETEDRR